MGVFLLKRFATFLATLLVASAVVFAVLSSAWFKEDTLTAGKIDYVVYYTKA